MYFSTTKALIKPYNTEPFPNSCQNSFPNPSLNPKAYTKY